MTPKDEAIVRFVKATLDDDNGVSNDAIEALYDLMDECESDSELSEALQAIRFSIRATDDRYYLKSDDEDN
jgi:hypothetical protein